MFNKRYPNQQAFTLIELLAALAVLSMLVVMLFLAFSNCNRMMVLGSNQMEKNQVVRAVLQQIARDLERTAYSSTAVNIYQPTTPGELIPGSGILTNTLYCLSTLSTDEGNVLGTVVNVGYQIAQVTTTNFGAPVYKWALQRGSDPYADPVTYPSAPDGWWNHQSSPANYWQTLSDNILGVSFQFYTDPVTPPASIWTAVANLPTSVGITIWAIDSDNYNRALSLDPSLSSAAALRMVTNNTHRYTSRIFLPQSTQN